MAEINVLLFKKGGFLNLGFWMVRFVLYFGLLTLMIKVLRGWSVKQDASGDPKFTRWSRRAACGFLPLFAVTATFAVVDWLMALDYTWFSTMWGVYLFAGSALSSMALLIVVVLLIVGSAMALVYWFRQWARDVRFAKAIIEKNPDYNANLQKHLIDVKNLEVGEVLGQGGSAVVRVGKYMGNDVALKIETVSQFPVEIPIQQKLKAAQAEAQMLLPLRHPNVVTR